MNSNRKYNEAMVKQFRKELKAMLDDIEDIDKIILNKAVNKGVKIAKLNTNVVTSFMRKSWRSTPAVKSKSGEVTKSLVNSMDYSEYVNYGHRIVNKNGETTGWVKGQFMLEKAIGVVERELVKEFKNEVERVNREHDK